jgi:hypothetical protein
VTTPTGSAGLFWLSVSATRADKRRGLHQHDLPTGVRLDLLLQRGPPLAELSAYRAWTRHEMPKYTAQLARIANGKG